MRKKDKESIFDKTMLSMVIDSMFFDIGTKRWYFDGYENTSQMVHFNYDGHKCILLEMCKPNVSDGTCIMVVNAKGKELKEWEDVQLNFSIQHFRFETLKRIAEELYAQSGLEEKLGILFDDYFKDNFGGFIDTYREHWGI